MAWLPSHQELRDHPKVARLARRLDIPEAHALGHLHMFWYWALDFALDGDLTRYDAFDIAKGARWDGEPDDFLQALIDCGWVDEHPVRIHDWDQYGGKLQAKREQTRQRVSRKRNALHERYSRASNEALEGEEDIDPPSVSPPTSPNGSAKHITNSLLEVLANQHPSLDVHDQLQRYRDWKAANGKKHKSEAAGFRNWLRKAEEIQQRDKPPPANGNGKTNIELTLPDWAKL